MHIVPHNKEEWLRALLFPFKAYTVIAPVMFFASVSLHPYRRFGPTQAEYFFVGSLLYDALILLFVALVLGFTGPRGFALPTAGFGLAAVILLALLLPALAR